MLNNSLNSGNCAFDYVPDDGLYYSVKVGADTVRKKCNDGFSIWNIGTLDIGGYKGTSFSIDATDVPGWNKLTTDNFILDFQWFQFISSGGSNNKNTYTKSYNPANGILTITNSMSQPQFYGSAVIVKVIVLYK